VYELLELLLLLLLLLLLRLHSKASLESFTGSLPESAAYE